MVPLGKPRNNYLLGQNAANAALTAGADGTNVKIRQVRNQRAAGVVDISNIIVLRTEAAQCLHDALNIVPCTSKARVRIKEIQAYSQAPGCD